MQRYFLEQDIVEQKVTISGNDAHHIKNVMRNKVGDTVIAVTSAQEVFELEIISIDKKSVDLMVNKMLNNNNENNKQQSISKQIELTIYQGLLKADKMELVIQKACELGATKLVPVIMQRSIAKITDEKQNKKLLRWRKIAKEAAEQAHRDCIMQVTDTITWPEIKNITGYDIVLLAYEGCRENYLYNTLVKSMNASKIAVIIGPEGGITEQELQLAISSGHKIVSLGDNILRAETAAISIAAGLLFFYQK